MKGICKAAPWNSINRRNDIQWGFCFLIANISGLYLPFLWEQSFCIRSPISLGYTRGHFSALVPTEPYSRIDGARDDAEDVTFLPLMDCEMKLLPIHFLTESEVS